MIFGISGIPLNSFLKDLIPELHIGNSTYMQVTAAGTCLKINQGIAILPGLSAHPGGAMPSPQTSWFLAFLSGHCA